MRVLERHIEVPVVKLARSKFRLRVTKMNGLQQVHWPDRCFWLPGGKPLLIEFKRPGEKPTPGQAAMIAALREDGYWVEVIDNKEKGIQLITEAVEASKSSRQGSPLPTRTRSRCFIPGSRNGKDIHIVKSLPGLTGGKNRKGNARNRS